MRAVFSFGTNDERLIQAIHQFKSNGGNLSKLICKLLENYFNGEIQLNNFNKELIKVRELYNELLEYKQKFEEWELKILEIEEKLKEQHEKQQLEEQLPLLRKLREVVFHDIEDLLEYDYYKQRQGLPPPEKAIKIRLTTFATEHNLSYPEARDLFFKAFPELNGRLEGVL